MSIDVFFAASTMNSFDAAEIAVAPTCMSGIAERFTRCGSRSASHTTVGPDHPSAYPSCDALMIAEPRLVEPRLVAKRFRCWTTAT
jgi:hypothetical protein